MSDPVNDGDRGLGEQERDEILRRAFARAEAMREDPELLEAAMAKYVRPPRVEA